MAHSEARLAVEEILSEVLAGVYNTDATSIVSCSRPRRNGPHFDLCGLARERCDLLKCYSLHIHAPTKQQVEICQIKCVEQKGSGYCGHYAFYFSLNLLKLCSCSSKEEAVQTLTSLTNRENFWKRYWISISQLLSQVGPESWWPWTREHVFDGEIERSYLKHLLQCDLSPHDRDRAFAIHFGYGMLQDSYEHVRYVQRSIDKFVNGNINYLLFILGITNHWVSLLAYKDKHSKIGLLYCDSNNEPVLQASDCDIEQLVKAREQKHIKRKGSGYTDWKRDTLRQSFFDQRNLVELLSKCLQGSHTLPSVLVSGHWESLLTNYNKHVTCHVTDDAGDSHIVRLIIWLESGYSVTALRDGYVKPLLYFGVDSLTATVRYKIEVWLRECSTIQPVVGLKQVNGFLDIVNHLRSILKM